MSCLYCLSENVEGALACVTCSRDIAIPASLVAGRSDLLQKRESIRRELHRARGHLVEMIRPARMRNPADGVSVLRRNDQRPGDSVQAWHCFRELHVLTLPACDNGVDFERNRDVIRLSVSAGDRGQFQV
jgi:hypothetical protein